MYIAAMLKIGHRGWRGNYPENSILGVQKAFELGISAIEIDVVVTKDHKLLVNHDPWIDHENNSIFNLDSTEASSLEYGLETGPKFPHQEKVKTNRPLLNDFLNAFDWMDKQLFLEIKSQPDWDNKYHPEPKDYAQLVIKEMEQFPYLKNVYFMCFDSRVLKALKYEKPMWKYLFLTENKLEENWLGSLGFRPNAVGVFHPELDRSQVASCHQDGIAVFPWTVNELNNIKRMQEIGVDGIISDYPNRLFSDSSDKGYR